MIRPRHLAIATGAAIVLGLLLVAGLRGVATPGAAPAPPRAPQDAPTAAPAAATAPTSPSSAVDGAPPPWMTGADAATPAPAEAIAPAVAQAPTPADISPAMVSMADDALARSVAGMAQARASLERLEAMEDPSAKGKIDVDGLRHNLDVAAKMQAVAQTMLTELRAPRTPEREQRLDALRAEMATLRAQLREDVTPVTANPSATAGQ